MPLPPRISRAYLAEVCAGTHALQDAEVHYLREVVRLRPGDPVAVFDGHGRQGEGVFSGHAVRVDQVTQVPAADTVTLAVSPPGIKRCHWLVEKLTELGVGELVWMQCARTQGARAVASPQRWERIVRAATRQCGRAHFMRVRGMVSFEAVLELPWTRRYIAQPGAPRAAPSAGHALILIGPEGGFSADEEARAGALTPIGLSNGILRVETAAVAAAVWAGLAS
jgi:16S rRNA (uracil1498-N3)-methyltransferase